MLTTFQHAKPKLGRPVWVAVAMPLALGACSTSGGEASKPATKTTVPQSTFAMDVTDVDYGSVTTDRRFKVSYSFPDAQGRFAVMSTDETGATEPVADASEFAAVNDDLAASVVCKDGLSNLQSRPTYVVADRAYQTTYNCASIEG